MLNQRDAWALAREAEPEANVVKTGNEKRLQINLRGKACKGRVTASKLSCNTYEKWPGCSSSYIILLVFF